jgi:hypothetical protein
VKSDFLGPHIFNQLVGRLEGLPVQDSHSQDLHVRDLSVEFGALIAHRGFRISGSAQ